MFLFIPLEIIPPPCSLGRGLSHRNNPRGDLNTPRVFLTGFIDPSVSGKLKIILATPQRKIREVSYNINHHCSGSLLSYIVKFVREGNVSLDKLDCLIVVNGVGSFTMTRLIVSTVNTIGWLYDLPIYSFRAAEGKIVSSVPYYSAGVAQKLSSRPKKKFKNFIKPIYSGKPNIIVKKL